MEDRKHPLFSGAFCHLCFLSKLRNVYFYVRYCFRQAGEKGCLSKYIIRKFFLIFRIYAERETLKKFEAGLFANASVYLKIFCLPLLRCDMLWSD